MESLDIDRPQELVSQAQAAIGPEYQVTADIDLLNAEEDEERGGRTDDDARAADITQALTSDDIAAIIAVRGGASTGFHPGTGSPTGCPSSFL